MPYRSIESICQTKSREIELDKTYQIIDEWLMVEDRPELNAFEDSKEGKANRNKLIERILIVTLVKNNFTRLVMSPEFVAGLFTTTETQQTDRHSESFIPTFHRSGSLTAASVDNLTSTQPVSVYAAVFDNQPSSELQVVKVLTHRQEDIQWPTSKVTSKATRNIQSMVARLQKSMVQPTGSFLHHLSRIHHEISRVAEINIFSHVTNALKKRNSLGVYSIDAYDISKDFHDLEMIIDGVQAMFTAMKIELLKVAETKRWSSTSKKITGLYKAFNSTLEWRLNEMLLHSSKQLKNIVRYLLQGFNVGSSQQAKFDRLLPRALYIAKCEGMDLYHQQPDWMTSGFHPRSLYCQSFSPFMRRVHLARYYARHLMETVVRGRL